MTAKLTFEITGTTADRLARMAAYSGIDVAAMLANALGNLVTDPGDVKGAEWKINVDDVVLFNDGSELRVARVIKVATGSAGMPLVSVVEEWSEGAWGVAYDDEDVEEYEQTQFAKLTDEEVEAWQTRFDGPSDEVTEDELLAKFADAHNVLH